VDIDVTREINASIDDVWRVLIDVERWPEWTQSVRSVALVEADTLARGVRARIAQPRMPMMTWEVTALDVGREFTWQSSRAGVTTIASHVLTAIDAHTTRALLGIRQQGRLAALMGVLGAATARRYVTMEADGLKARCDGGASHASD
jgi:uncharacterized protein YndB with AHSA1/START domain